jgi:hypothetical protein
MKTFLPIVAAVSVVLLPSLHAADVTSFVMPVDSAIELSGQIAVINSADGAWKALAQKLEKTDDGFKGAVVGPDGKDINLDGQIRQNGKKWTGSVKWNAGSEIPSAFLLLTYIIPMDQLAGTTMVSGKEDISFEKMAQKIPTRNNFTNVTEFTLGPISGATLNFSINSPSEVQALILGDNMYIRIYLTPSREPLASSGSAEWSVEKQ